MKWAFLQPKLSNCEGCEQPKIRLNPTQIEVKGYGIMHPLLCDDCVEAAKKDKKTFGKIWLGYAHEQKG